MKLCSVLFVVLAAAAASLALEHGPLINVLQPESTALEQAEPQQNVRQKRFLLGAGALGAGAIGAGVLGLGAVGLGAGLIGAKAGLIGGAIAGSALRGRSFGGGWGYGGGYGYGGYAHAYPYYGGYGGYGHGYRTYYPTTYYVSDPWC